ncbi:MAG: hypothetical protein FWG38_09160 [Defluviitaleaceae bacterium]|nr:hypothetical protein [Defluviitaleaceae bacterium]
MKVPKTKFPVMKIARPKPYIHIACDAGLHVVSQFFAAVCTNPDKAWAFVSKIYSAGIDLNELRELVISGIQPVRVASYVHSPKNCTTRSFYVRDKRRKVRKLLHLHMVKEPDHNGKWKIFGVEQEECNRIL